MFLDVQPAHVCVEETTGGIVGVGVSLGIFVVDAVIAGPVEDGSLVGDGVADHEEETCGEGGGVGSMGPEAMDAYCYTESTVFELGGL
mmetsp:Transcript_26179/g.56184  ORF Transcript_26179/g.56184 Transcript_26179/m.56184 type:complete len:88 (+) Transcript_26179:802-1065(+)